MQKKTYDLIVIGGGPGGYVAAIRAAQLGLEVAVIEKEHLGGICLNWGCIPTKAMLRSAEIFSTLKRSHEFGVSAQNITFDLQKIIQRSKKIASQLSKGVKHLLAKQNIAVFEGLGVLKSHNSVSITTKDGSVYLTASNIIVATGARARELKGLESDGHLIWNYRHALRPSRIPKKILVVGSGAIGVEFSSFYNSLGADVTIIENFTRIMPNEDHDIASFAKKEFLNKGIKIFENSTVKGVTKKNNETSIEMSLNGKLITEKFDAVIVAAGIVGNIENIGLENVGIKTKNDHIITTKYCETSVENIFAIGDVAEGPWLAHKASHEGLLVAERAAGLDPRPIRENSIAACTFCEPQIASVGLTEAKAREIFRSIRVGKFPFTANGKALAIGDGNGFVKTIFDAETGELLGAHLIGPEVTELIQSFALGKQLEGTDEDFFETIFPHPTLSEAIHESVLNSSGRTIHF